MNKTSLAQQNKITTVLSPTQGILQRKCACGNKTVAGGECTACAKKASGLQRKLAIDASNDPLEREADRVADQVMAMPINSSIRKAPPRIQRFTEQSTSLSGTAPASVDRVLASSGRPLEPVLRHDMEQRFGHDFSQVRVHSDRAAEKSAREVSANAYTVKNNIVFGAGQYAPGTKQGLRLLAHEMTHVVQQDATKQPTSVLDNNCISHQTGHLLQREGITVRSPVFEEAVTQVATVAGAALGRSLTSAERTLAFPVFGSSLDYDRIRLVPTSVLEYRTIANNIMIPQNFSITNAQMAQTLIHELTHVWQYQHNGTSYISISLGRQISASISRGNRNFAYDYQIQSGQSFFNFAPEQQAFIVENYYSMLRDRAAIRSAQPGAPVVNYRSNHLASNGFRRSLNMSQRLSEISTELPLHQPLIRQMQQALPRLELDLLDSRARDLMRTPGEDLIPVPEERRMVPLRPLFEVRF